MTVVDDGQFHEESLWFGNTKLPIFGRLTTPNAATARGGVLLSSPIGRESRLARRALRSLAILLAVDGYASLRFDHYGSGDSGGSMDDDELDRALMDGVEQGTALLRSLGPISISAVGMRMGATIIGAAASKHDLDFSSFVMWDPCESGRAYVRELSALGSMRRESVTTDLGESVKMLEYPLSDDAASQIGEFNLREPLGRPLAERILVVVRDDRPVSDKFRANWDSNHVDWMTTTEQGALFEAQLPTSIQPATTIAAIRSWLTRSEPAPGPIAVPIRAREAVVRNVSNGFAVRESLVELGPRGMFAVVSEPVGEVQGPLVVMVNGVNEDHIGPARLWVELSREWTSLGLRCVRFDFSELGESPWLPGQPDRPIFDKTRSEDVVQAVRALSPVDPSDTVLVGYCSGAQLAFEVALDLNPVGVCAINPEVAATVFRSVDRVKNSRRGYVQTLVHHLEGFLKRHRRFDQEIRRFSRFVVSFAYPPKFGSALVKSRAVVLLLLSPEDVPRFQGIPVLRRRLVSTETFHVEVVPGMDHAILNTLGRERAVAILNQHVIQTFVRAVPSSPPDSAGSDRT